MGIVAIAGGTGGVGRTIAEKSVEYGHKVFVLGRSEPKDPTPGTTFIKADYSDTDGLAKSLQDNNIESVVSTIVLMDPETLQSQNNLITAAAKSTTANKFVLSEFAGTFTKEMAQGNPIYKYPALSVDHVRGTGLQWTRIANGFFMDYWGQPHVPSHLRHFPWYIDAAARRAALPGTGNDKLTLTYTYDLASAVARILDWPEWPEQVLFGGDDLTFNEMVAILAKARGGQPFDVEYASVEDLKAGRIKILTDHAPPEYSFLVPTLGLDLVNGVMKLPDSGRINGKLGDFKPSTFEEFVTKAWKGQ